MSNYSHPEVLVGLDWAKANADRPGIKSVASDVDTASYESGNLIGAPIQNPAGGSTGTK